MLNIWGEGDRGAYSARQPYDAKEKENVMDVTADPTPSFLDMFDLGLHLPNKVCFLLLHLLQYQLLLRASSLAR